MSEQNPDAVIVKTKSPVSVVGTWDAARSWLEAAKRMEQGKLFCQVMAGFTIQALHKEHGIKAGNPQLSHDGTIGKGQTWDEILEKELGLSKSTAHRYIDMSRAALPRLKKLPALRDFDPAAQSVTALPEKQQAALETAVKKITDGVTQKEFGEQLGLWKKPAGAGAKGRKPGEGGRKKLSLAEQAELLKVQAVEDWKGMALAHKAYGSKFCVLSDEEVTTQTAILERELMARKCWLKQPVDKRDPKAIEALLVAVH